MEILIYIGFTVLLFGIGWLALYFKNKSEKTAEDFQSDIEFLYLTMVLVDYIIKNLELKTKFDLSLVTRLTIFALDFVDGYIDENTSYEQRKELVRDRAIQLCLDWGISLEENGEIEVIVDMLIDKLLKG